MISATLLEEIDAYAARLRQSSRLLGRARAGVLSQDAVARYLANIHFLISHTPEHLNRATERALALGRPELADYFCLKLAEEEGHERWAEDDMEAMGRLSGRRVLRQPSEAMLRLIRNIERAIDRDPHQYVAYILFAECLTVRMGPEWVAALEQRCGVPATALTVATHHIELDKAHVEDGCRELDELVGNDETRLRSMLAMLRSSMDHFDAFCDDLCDADCAAA
jgi:hypothetical protein